MAVCDVGCEKFYLSTDHRIRVLFSHPLSWISFLFLAATQILILYLPSLPLERNLQDQYFQSSCEPENSRTKMLFSLFVSIMFHSNQINKIKLIKKFTVLYPFSLKISITKKLFIIFIASTMHRTSPTRTV